MKPRNGLSVYWAVAIICLIYGGVALVLFANQMYFLYAREQMPPSREHGESPFARNFTEPARNISFQGMDRQGYRNALALPLASNFLGSLVSIFAGVSLIRLIRKREKKEIKKEIIDTMIMPDEKTVINELENSNGELTQSELVRKSKLSKVKVHRIIKRLESLGIVKKYPFGVTNKIKLEKEVYNE